VRVLQGGGEVLRRMIWCADVRSQCERAGTAVHARGALLWNKSACACESVLRRECGRSCFPGRRQTRGETFDVLLEPGSLYMLWDESRYAFSHSILAGANGTVSWDDSRSWPVGRRLSLVARSAPCAVPEAFRISNE
jgi:hypothetical protein